MTMSNPGVTPPPTIYEIDTPSGSVHAVVGDSERDLYLDLSSKYQDQFKMTNISDLVDLDRLLAMEVLVWRLQQFLSQDADYEGARIDSSELHKKVKEQSQEIRLLKKSMGMDKLTRAKAAEESLIDYVENLKVRAKEFGVMRNEQAVKAITLLKELESLVTLWNNTTPDEREEMKCDLDDIMEWIQTFALPEFNDIDTKFRQTQQKYWRTEL